MMGVMHPVVRWSVALFFMLMGLPIAVGGIASLFIAGPLGVFPIIFGGGFFAMGVSIAKDG